MRLRTCCILALAGIAGFSLSGGADGKDKDKDSSKAAAKPTPKAASVWTDASDPALPIDYKFQGEFWVEGTGVQVIALGEGQFQAVVLPGGLPGDGWDAKHKSLMQGKLNDGVVQFEPATGNRTYIAGPADEFSATPSFPPEGQKNLSGRLDASGVLTMMDDSGKNLSLNRVTRHSSTQGAKPPANAIVLFDGSNSQEWRGGRVDNQTLHTDGHDIISLRKFNNYTAHVEFCLPFRPQGRGQGRGNSGFYQVHHYELQILDSFGLAGKNNECGGIYTKAAPTVNMCYPPLTWQTYDVDFTNSVVENGTQVKNARITVRHNGVVVQDNVEIDGPTGGHRKDPEGTPGPLLLQGHGNPLQFRNIWVVEKE